jgi:hypothetical protein
MKSIATSAGLKMVIHELELRQAAELVLLKEEYDKTCNSLKPVNMIRNSVKEAIAVPGFKTDVINAAVGLTAGILAKKLMIGKTSNPFKTVLGVIVEMAVAGTVANNTDELKAAGSAIFKTLFTKKEEKVTP